MRTRDRLDELRQLSVSAADGAVYVDTVVAAHAGDAERDKLLQDILADTERTMGWIHELSSLTQRVRRLHAHPTYHNNKQLQEQLDSAVTTCTALGAKISGALRQLEARGGGAVGGGAGGAAGRAARLQGCVLRRRFTDALVDHQAALAALRDNQRALLHDQIKLTNLEITEEECERLLDNNNVSMFVDNVEAESREALLTLRAAEARHAELQRVERALGEVRDLFMHLAHLVDKQQEQIDSVEYFALQASEHVGVGGHELLQGQVTKNKSRKKKLSLIICLMFGFAVVLFVLIFT